MLNIPRYSPSLCLLYDTGEVLFQLYIIPARYVLIDLLFINLNILNETGINQEVGYKNWSNLGPLCLEVILTTIVGVGYLQ